MFAGAKAAGCCVAAVAAVAIALAVLHGCSATCATAWQVDQVGRKVTVRCAGKVQLERDCGEAYIAVGKDESVLMCDKRIVVVLPGDVTEVKP